MVGLALASVAAVGVSVAVDRGGSGDEREGAGPPRRPSRARGRVLLDGLGRAGRPGRLRAALPERGDRGAPHLPGQPVPQLLRRGPGAPGRRRCSTASRDEPMCKRVVEPRHHEGVVRHGLDGPAAHRRARGPALGDLRRLRRPHPLHGRAHRRADPPRRGDRRHHQGHAHRRSRRAARSSTRARATTCSASSPSTGPGEAEVLWTLDSESVGPVLWNDDWDSSPIVLGDYLVVGQREQPLLGDQAQPHHRRGGPRAGGAHRWCSPPRRGTRRCSRPTATRWPRSRAPSPSTRTRCTSAPRPG